MSYELAREGDAWIYTWPEYGVGIGIDQITDRRDGLWCELTIQQITSGQALHLHGPARTNLVSTTARETLAKHLKPKAEQVPWGELIEIACARTTKEHRQGEPVVRLSDIEVPKEGLPYLIWPMLPENETTLIFGAHKSLKSTLALALGIAVATGQELPHMKKAEKQTSVLYLDWESQDIEHAERLEWLCRGFGIAKPTNMYYRPMHRPLHEEVSRIREIRAEVKAGYVIYDSLAGACGDDMKEQHVATSAITSMRLIGGTRAVIGHKNREEVERKTGPSHVYGSVFFDAYARSIWEVQTGDDLEPDGDDALRVMGVFHRAVNRGRLVAKPLMLRMAWFHEEQTLRIYRGELDDDQGVAGHATMDFRIRDALKRGIKSAREIAEGWGEPEREKSIGTLLSQMHGVIQMRPARPGKNGEQAAWGLVGVPYGH